MTERPSRSSQPTRASGARRNDTHRSGTRAGRRPRLALPLALAAAAGILAGPVARAQAPVDPELESYTPVSGISGTLKSVGSDTMNNLMALWAEGFRRHYPGVKLAIEGKGSSTAPPALIQGTAHFGPMSRQMKNEEVDAFEKAFGYPPTRVRTSLDVLAVYVHRDNPIQALSLEQLDAIFSKTRRSGASASIDRWGELGLEGTWAESPIRLYGRNSASGTYGYFKKHALFKGDYRDSVKEQPGSAAVVQAVASDRTAIGYTGIGFLTPDVRAVPLRAKNDAEAVTPNAENAYAGRYPLGRFLYLYVNVPPHEGLDPLRREFLRFVLSREGQEVVVKDGYIPLPARIARMEKQALGLVPREAP